MSDKDKLYEVWENIPTDYRMFFLVNQSAMLLWDLNKASDAGRLKDFRERLQATLSFADIEVHELAIRSKLKSLLDTDITESSADTLAEISEEVSEYLSKQDNERKE